MSGALQFRTVDSWRAALGLLPVPLRDAAVNPGQYVLLNGTVGNFCLDFVGGIDPISQRATAWSCDVGHYINCTDDYVVVNRWGREAPEERYTRRSVVENLHEFHRHIEKTEPDRSQSIAVHVLRVFRRIRAAVGEKDNGLRSLRVLLHLLASAAARENRLSDRELALWGLSSEVVEPSRSITEATWRPLYDDLSGFGRYDVLRPDFQLLLRHASGAVFQDAHLEASSSPAFWLPGFEMPVTIDAKAVPTETGVYFTPPAIARTLAEEATSNLNDANGRFLLIFDPACGSGELLKECLRLLKVKEFTGRVKIIGWDKSPTAVDMARFVLAWEKRAWLSGQVEIEIAQHDSTTSERWPVGADVVIMNPPFKSWQLMTHEEQEGVRRILGPSSKPNLAMVFARRALDALADGGVLATITPNSLLEGGSGRETREAMASALTPELVGRLGDQSIFSRALVDAGMYVGRKKPAPARATAVLWADSRQSSLNQALRGLRKWRGAEAGPISGEGFSVYCRDDVATTGDPWAARGYEAWSLHRVVQDSDKMLPARRLFDIRQGIRLGSDVFVVSKEYVQRLRRNERRFFRPAVMNPSLVDAKLTDAYYVFYPYTSGLPAITTEAELEEHVPQYFKDYLRPAKPALRSRKTLVRQTELHWWDLLWHRAWQTERNPKIVSKYFGSKRSFAFDRSGDFVVVVGNAWLLKKGTTGVGITDEEIYCAVLTYLSSAVAYDLLKYVSTQVSGGQLDLSNRYVGNLPLVDLARIKPAHLSQMINIGAQISEGIFENWTDVDDLMLTILRN